ncbi:MAG: OsmC family protein [Cypionkella sp.]
MNIQTKPAENGVNVAALLNARETLKGAPEAARFKWRASSKWLKGTHSRAEVNGFYGLGGEHVRRQTYKFEMDYPEAFASEDHAATPVEYVLVGLAGCLTAGIAAVAQNRNIQLRSVKATVEGGMDLLGILGADPGVRNGFDGVTVHFEVDADASAEEIAALVAQSQKRSAVFDVVSNPTDVAVTSSKK